MPRRKSSQSKHDREVRRTADSLKRRGFKVDADVPGYNRPDTIRGYRPDVVARKGWKRVIVEVETTDSANSARDVKQQRAFRAAAKTAKHTSFRRKVTK
jgi:hypothetical protein